jgi:RimJ/RimL family protein N-acetyltransferase
MDDPSDIDTERLTLRRPTLADFDDAVAMYADADVTRHLGGRTFTREECWMRLLRGVGHWQLFGFGFWVVRVRQSEQYVGEVGFGEFRRDIQPNYEGTPEIGWVLARSAHRQGYATESALAAHRWLEARHGACRTVCIIEPENAGSLRVAAKCGYTEFARTTYRNSTVILFERIPEIGRAIS